MSDRLAEGYTVVIIDARINEARQANDASLDDKTEIIHLFWLNVAQSAQMLHHLSILAY